MGGGSNGKWNRRCGFTNHMTEDIGALMVGDIFSEGERRDIREYIPHSRSRYDCDWSGAIRAVEKNVEFSTINCPDCGHALFWQNKYKPIAWCLSGVTEICGRALNATRSRW